MIGGVIGGAAVLLLGMWWQGDDLAALHSKVAEIEGTVASGASEASGQTADGDLVSRVEAIEAKADAQGALEERLAALESGPSSPDLTGRLAEGNPQLTQLEDRIAKLESGAGPAGTAAAPVDDSALKALQERLSSLEAGQSQIDQRLGAAEQAGGQLEQLSGSVDQLAQKLDADAQQSAALATEVSTLGERVSGTESKIETADQNRGRATALALIAGQLEAAIGDARPYQTQVQALNAMTGADGSDDQAIKQAVSALEPGAAAGVPSVAALRRSFESVANEIVQAANATGGDNLLDRATDNLMSLVTVRPVGDDVRGDSVEARVARAEAALDKGDLASAVGEVDQLEGRPAAAAAAWLEQAKARLGADQAVAQLRSQATDLLRQNP